MADGGGLVVSQSGPRGWLRVRRFVSQNVGASLKVMLYNRFTSLRL